MPVRTPCVGLTVTANVNGLRAGTFGSEPVRVIAVAVLCATATVCALAVGAAAATFSVTVAGLLVLPAVLVTVNWKLSAPL